MYAARAICANRGKEIITAETNKGIFELAAIACEEDSACAGTIADAEYITLFEDGAKGGCGKRVVVTFIAVGMVCDGVTADAG